MAKKGDKHTSPDGKTWVYTDGGNWREYVNGKATNNISKGSTPPGGAAADASAGSGSGVPAGQQTINNTAPAAQSPAAAQYMAQANAAIQQQIAQGLSPAQGQAELERQQKYIAGLSPALQQEALNLSGQVQSGGINQAQLENQIYNSQVKENATAPQTDKSVNAQSTTAEVTNQIFDTAKAGTMAGNTLTNPNQVNDFGSSTVTIDPVTGQPTVKQDLSQGNKDALKGIQGTGVQASQVAQGLLGNQYGQFVQGAGPQSGYNDPELEKAVYGRLTRDFGDRFGREEEQLNQTLANRGIAVGSQAYTNAMGDFRKNRDLQYETAQQNAVQQGTQTALQRQANNVSGLGALNQGVGTLAGTGQAGLVQPNFQGFQSTQYAQPDLQALYSTQYAGDITKQGYETELKKQQIAADATKGIGGGGGGGGRQQAAANPAPANAFSSRPPGS